MDSILVVMQDIALKLSEQSTMDSTSIFIVVAMVMLLIIFAAMLYKILFKNFTILNESINNIAQKVDNSLGSNHVFCRTQSKETSDMVEERIMFIESAVRNLFNTVVELMDNSGIVAVPTWLAIKLFDTIMELYCLKKASLLYEKTKHDGKSPDDIINTLSREFRAITEEKKALLDKVLYQNANRLGAELEPLLRNDEWERFTRNEITTLVRKFIGRNTDWVTVKDATLTMLSARINQMKRNIESKGEKK